MDDVLLFLDYDGVLHPDAVYQTSRGLKLRAPGRMLMHAGVLDEILVDFPQVKVALSTSWVRLLSFSRARAVLPASIQARIVGATWHSKMPRAPEYGYDMQTRYEQIRAAATRGGMTRWVALDDDPDHSWPEQDDRLIPCDSTFGLGSVKTQSELRAKLSAMLERSSTNAETLD